MKYDIYKDTTGLWRWRLVKEGRIIAVSPEGYPDKEHCFHAIDLIRGAPSLEAAPSSETRLQAETSGEAKRALSVFLCHSSNDKILVRDLYIRLRSTADYIVPWLDEENLLPGQKWEVEIPLAVSNSDIVLVCLSKASIQKTGYVQKEIKFALDAADTQPEGAIFIIPVKFEECQIPQRLRHLQYVNLFEDQGYDRLMRALFSGALQLGITTSMPSEQTIELSRPEFATIPTEENWILNIQERQVRGVCILDLKGKIVIGEGSVAIRYAIRRLIEEGKSKILMNLEGVTHIDNSGIGEFVASYAFISRSGGQLKLLNLTQKIEDLLRITKTLTLFDAYDDEIAALESFT